MFSMVRTINWAGNRAQWQGAAEPVHKGLTAALQGSKEEQTVLSRMYGHSVLDI